MTTQILIGNGHGLALATDSAVTVGGRRTYETSEKLIVVDEPHSVAVLVSGAVTQFSLPIQVLVGEWAKSISTTRLRKVVDYRESFMSWLRDNVTEFPEHDSRLVDAFWNVDSYLHYCWKETSGSKADEDLETRTNATLEYLEYWINKHSEFDKIDYFDNYGGEQGAQRILDELWNERKGLWIGLNARLDFWFDDVDPAALTQVKDSMRRLLLNRIATWDLFGDSTSVTFAGYGSKEMVPHCAEVRLFGGYRDWVTSFSVQPQSASKIDEGYFLLRTIGQTEYIDNVLRGYRSELIESAAGALAKAENQGTEGESLHQTDGVDSNVNHHDLKEQLRMAVEQRSEEELLVPLRRAVSAMPLKSLADAARSLVGVQALGKAISAELPTTGGKIEVAVITRADGVRVLTQS